MLGFLRAYQRVLFFLVTVIVIISFSFFGTYSAFNYEEKRERPAFTAVDGEVVDEEEVEAMGRLLGFSDHLLNDGLIEKELLMTGALSAFTERYREALQKPWENLFERERLYELYSDPQAPGLGVEALWREAAPELAEQFALFKKSKDPLDPAAVEARAKLYLGQLQLPPNYLKQLLLYRRQQLSLARDPALEQADLSLFGHRNLSDWITPEGLRYLSALVINGAKLAEKKGLVLSKEEARLSLLNQAKSAYRQLGGQRLREKNSGEFFARQLRLLGLREEQAVELWRKALLFRKLLEAPGQGCVVDRLCYDSFYSSAGDLFEIEKHSLLKELRLASFRDLQLFELYLKAVSRQYDPKDLSLFSEMKGPEELAVSHPELVERSLKIRLREFDKKALEARISVKETLSWQLEERNWEKLRRHAASLPSSAERSERAELLRALDPEKRDALDAFAREQIIEENPEWVEEGLSEQPGREALLSLRLGGPPSLLKGFADSKELIEAFEKEALVNLISGDGRHYYRLERLEEPSPWRIVSLADAKKEGILSRMLQETLKEHYLELREADPLLYRLPGGEWKPFEKVRELVAKSYFQETLASLRALYFQRLGKEAPRAADRALVEDLLASWRLVPFVDSLRKSLSSGEPVDQNPWQLLKERTTLRRGDPEFSIWGRSLFDLEEGDWSESVFLPRGDLGFFQLLGKRQGADEAQLVEAMRRGRLLLPGELKAEAFRALLAEIDRVQPMHLEAGGDS